ncbi:hypothetical protein, partial [Legionella sp. CNM-4043-24]|uniref:hypothetical protein n=1 Tax=Legionella sp. CNM-4043-24 TaxID=3421646 RepID=UPI00403AF7EB
SMPGTKPVVFWRGVVAAPKEYELYKRLRNPQIDRAIWKVCATHYNAADLERLSGVANTYSIRINRGDRIILRAIER